jgi:MoaA/NifB/PqqE/SkfB family radical SAM enzyme
MVNGFSRCLTPVIEYRCKEFSRLDRDMDLPHIIQVEVTTACQAECTFCPRTQLKDGWISKNIEWEDFSCILPAVRRGTLVHLQGWGEPLLHPRLWDMAVAVRKKGGRVSLTTNGRMLDQAASREVCRAGFAFVAFSLAGAASRTHDALRPGTGLDLVSENIERLHSLKGRPRIHIAFQMTRDNLEQLPEVVKLAAKLGADRVIASNLDCITSPVTDALRAFGEADAPHAEAIVAAAKRSGKENKIEVEIFPLRLRDNVPVCRADPLHTALVTCTGEVAPCSYLWLPLRGDMPRYFEGKKEAVPPFTYGKIRQGLRNVMEGEKARDFLGLFKRRMEAAVMADAKGFALLALPGLRSIRESQYEAAARPLPPAPGPCLHCYKLYGA